ncbi:FdhF/YdeP family oxidoreductase [Vibrio nigripulchritudo]|uniref:FdhF/YdeP family oxidoreductase n=1 Tax=Vibrio nigripulchritudo TaxID=28173 RepID=UPI0005F9DB3C|nr:FdhF/YdeP family oxidoreductase [Vibrio nigripulchritudo]KJY67298.1 CbbBc protein [Vibrio nigripulchritudo]
MTVKKYKGNAGGWGALMSTTQHLMKSESVIRNIRNLLSTNQHDGFDCPGCAWGELEENRRFKFCENGAKAVNWEATSRRVRADFFATYPVSWLAKQSDYFLEDQGRLSEPMVYNAESDHYQPIRWGEAFELIARHLKALPDPNQAEFYTSGRASNEAAFLYQLFVRAYGTNNFPDCSNMCHEASGVALKQSIGVGKGTVTLNDFEHADAIFVFGQNPGTNHPRMLDTLRSASLRGANIVTFNTLKERGLQKFTNPQAMDEMLTGGGTQLTHHYFTPKLGGDMAVVRGMAKALLAMEERAPSSVFDAEFIKDHTLGLETYLDTVRATPWDKITEQSGLKQNEIELAARIYQQSENVILTWAMGITQHHHSVKTIQEMANLQLLCGQIGKKGSGLCPVRGHSNVQGDRTMGIDEKAPAALLDSLEAQFGFNPPRKAGHNTVQAIQAMENGESKVFIALGGNFAAATPDTERTLKALASCELTVNIATKLNRTHVTPGKASLLLPCLGRTDIDLQKNGAQKVTVEDSFSMVHASGGVVESDTANMRSEPVIVAGMANAVLGKNPVDWLSLVEDYNRIRDLIERTIPGFDDFNQRIKEPGGFYLGNRAAERIWMTESNRATFHSHELPDSIIKWAKPRKNSAPVFVLQTMRSHDQYNTTIYGFNDRYRGVTGERKVLFINSSDIKLLGLEEGDRVTITACWGDDIERKVSEFKLVPYDIPAGNLAAYFPETNPLVALDSHGELSFTPISKSIPVTIEKIESSSVM